MKYILSILEKKKKEGRKEDGKDGLLPTRAAKPTLDAIVCSSLTFGKFQSFKPILLLYK